MRGRKVKVQVLAFSSSTAVPLGQRSCSKCRPKSGCAIKFTRTLGQGGEGDVIADTNTKEAIGYTVQPTMLAM